MKLAKQIPVVAVLILLLMTSFTPSIAQDAPKTNLPDQTFTIVDSLNGLSTSSILNIGGTAGNSVSSEFHVGPEFTIAQRTVITEIGAFLAHFRFSPKCAGNRCPAAFPMIVEIRPSTNGFPDLSTVIASFTLTEDFNPDAVVYESASPNLTLSPGTYFALFAGQGNDQGYVLGIASFPPPPFFADTIRLGVIIVSEGRSLDTTVPAAVRILGRLAFDRCLQDDGSQNTFSFTTETGEYQFTNCHGLTVGGVGRITNRGCLTVLEDVRPDRRVLVRIDSCTLKATAAIQLFSQGATFTIADRNISNSSCVCQ